MEMLKIIKNSVSHLTDIISTTIFSYESKKIENITVNPKDSEFKQEKEESKKIKFLSAGIVGLIGIGAIIYNSYFKDVNKNLPQSTTPNINNVIDNTENTTSNSDNKPYIQTQPSVFPDNKKEEKKKIPKALPEEKTLPKEPIILPKKSIDDVILKKIIKNPSKSYIHDVFGYKLMKENKELEEEIYIPPKPKKEKKLETKLQTKSYDSNKIVEKRKKYKKKENNTKKQTKPKLKEEFKLKPKTLLKPEPIVKKPEPIVKKPEPVVKKESSLPEKIETKQKTQGNFVGGFDYIPNNFYHFKLFGSGEIKINFDNNFSFDAFIKGDLFYFGSTYSGKTEISCGAGFNKPSKLEKLTNNLAQGFIFGADLSLNILEYSCYSNFRLEAGFSDEKANGLAYLEFPIFNSNEIKFGGEFTGKLEKPFDVKLNVDLIKAYNQLIINSKAGLNYNRYKDFQIGFYLTLDYISRIDNSYSSSMGIELNSIIKANNFIIIPSIAYNKDEKLKLGFLVGYQN